MTVTAQELIQTVGNERASPLLLPYHEEVIEAANAQLRAQEEKVEQIKENLPNLDEIQQKFVQAMELEILRWKYLIRVYMTTRFKKIQALVGKLIIPIQTKLTETEWTFCQSFQESMSLALGGATEFTDEEEDLTPFVFFKALVDMDSMLLSSLETNEAIDIQKNQIYFARLEHVLPLVNDGRAALL